VKATVLSSFSVNWLPTAPLPGTEIKVPDHREALCSSLRALAAQKLVEIVEPQKRPDYEDARKAVRS
jgi:hypothetical protein